MAVKFGMLVQQMFDMRVLLGTMAFVKSSIPVGASLWNLCSYSAHAYLYLSSFISADYFTGRSVGFRTIWLYRLLLDVVLTILVLCVIFINLMLKIWSTYLLITWNVWYGMFLAVCCDSRPNYVFIHFCSFCSFYCILTVFYCIVWFCCFGVINNNNYIEK